MRPYSNSMRRFSSWPWIVAAEGLEVSCSSVMVVLISVLCSTMKMAWAFRVASFSSSSALRSRTALEVSGCFSAEILQAGRVPSSSVPHPLRLPARAVPSDGGGRQVCGGRKAHLCFVKWSDRRLWPLCPGSSSATCWQATSGSRCSVPRQS